MALQKLDCGESLWNILEVVLTSKYEKSLNLEVNNSNLDKNAFMGQVLRFQRYACCLSYI